MTTKRAISSQANAGEIFVKKKKRKSTSPLDGWMLQSPWKKHDATQRYHHFQHGRERGGKSQSWNFGGGDSNASAITSKMGFFVSIQTDLLVCHIQLKIRVKF